MVLILDDYPLVREGLCAILQMHMPQVEIHQAGTVEEAIGLAVRLEVTLAFIDIKLAKESGFRFLSWLKQNKAEVKAFLITSSSRQEDFFHAKELGAEAYVLKDAFVDEILYGLKVVERGGRFYSTAIIEQMNRAAEEQDPVPGLTERELDVLLLLSKGYGNARISKELFISEGTVKKHISSILGKLGFLNRVEAVIYANKHAAMIRMAQERLSGAKLEKKGCAV